jgi:hypothetical protein
LVFALVLLITPVPAGSETAFERARYRVEVIGACGNR